MKESVMLRRFIIAIATVAALGISFSSTNASAGGGYRGWHEGGYWHGGGGWYGCRGLFGCVGWSYPNCGCASYGYPVYGEPAVPYVYSQPYEPYEQPYVRPYYEQHEQPYVRPYYRRSAIYRPYRRAYVRPYYRANHRRW
jgi:hypothetical protein